jgi:HEAT repeat protein
MTRMTRTKRTWLIAGLVLAALAAGLGLKVWDLHARAGLPMLVKDRMPGYWQTALLSPPEVRQAARGLYAGKMADRRQAAVALRNLGLRAAPAQPWLLAALADGAESSDNKAPPLMAPDDPAGRAAAQKGQKELEQQPSWTERLLAYFLPPREPESVGSTTETTSTVAGDALAELGPAAVPALVAALTDPLPEVRLEAARALGNIADPRAIEPLRRALDDRHFHVRRMAAAALGQFDDPRVLETLTALCLQVEPYYGVRLRAGLSLSTLGEPGRRALADMLSDSRLGVRQLAANALAGDSDLVLSSIEPDYEGDLLDPPHDPAILDALVTASRGDASEKNRFVVAHVIQALRRYRGDRALEALVEALGNRSFSFVERGLAANGLRNLKDPRAVGPLLEVLNGVEKDRGEEVREHVAYVLARLGTREAVEGLTAALKNPSAKVRQCAAGALGSLKDPAMADALAALLDDPDVDRVPVAIDLANLGDARGMKIIVGSMTGERQEMITEAIVHLGAAAVGPLLEAPRGSDHHAKESLAALRDPKAFDALMAIAGDPEHPLRPGAIVALGHLGDKRAGDLMASLINEQYVGPDALSALAEIGDDRARAPLLAALATARVDQVRSVFADLGRLKDPRTCDAILAAMKQLGLWPLPTDARDPRNQGCEPIFLNGPRIGGAEALLAAGDPRGLEVSFDLFGHWSGKSPVRLAALGEAGFQPLVAALADPRESVRGQAALALIDLAGPRALSSIRAAMPNFTIEDRERLIEALAPMKLNEISEFLQRFVETEGRSRLAEAATQIKDAAAGEFLRQLAAADPDPDLRVSALGHLYPVRVPADREALRRAATADPLRAVRAQAWTRLEKLAPDRRPSDIPHRWIDRRGTTFRLL